MKYNQLIKNSVYQKLLIERAIDSKVSFNSIETPGWSSMVRTEKGSKNNSNRGDLNNVEYGPIFNGIDIANRLIVKQNKKDQRHSDIRFNSKEQNRPPTVIQTGLLGIKKKEKQPKMRLSQRIQLKTNNECLGESESADSFVYSEYPQEQKVYRMDKQRMILIDKEIPKLSKKQSRFKQITIFEHLYQHSRKMESRKALEAILEQKYSNQHTTTFKPSIDRNSVKIFERKCADKGNKEEKNNTSIKINRISPKRSNESQMIAKEKQLFMYLSGSSGEIKEESVNQIIKEMPMPCIRLLEKILQRIYSGQHYTQSQFNSVLNEKKIVINKQRLLNLFDKWLKSNNSNNLEESIKKNL